MFLIVDFEATCWDKTTDEGRVKTNRNENEIIEIGYSIVTDDYQIIKSQGLFVKPQLNPILSDFCKQLTGIEQFTIDNANDFKTVMDIWQHNVYLITDRNLSDFIFCSWGFYDHRQLAKDCKRNNIEVPFKISRSLKHEFAEKYKIKPVGMSKVLSMLNIPLEGHHHSGVDDAYNIAKIFIKEKM
jgi:inhibitor of KinA sporulation pathway (predicted exonuclease)